MVYDSGSNSDICVNFLLISQSKTANPPMASGGDGCHPWEFFWAFSSTSQMVYGETCIIYR